MTDKNIKLLKLIGLIAVGAGALVTATYIYSIGFVRLKSSLRGYATQTSKFGVELIKYFEGLRLNAYKDAAGVYTIGYGHTSGVKPGQVITEAQANAYLLQDIKDAEDVVNSLGVKLNQNQFDAVVDFIFNFGETKFRKYNISKLIQANPNDPNIYEAFMDYTYGGGKQLPGLVDRRGTEAEVYFGNTNF